MAASHTITPPAAVTPPIPPPRPCPVAALETRLESFVIGVREFPELATMKAALEAEEIGLTSFRAGDARGGMLQVMLARRDVTRALALLAALRGAKAAQAGQVLAQAERGLWSAIWAFQADGSALSPALLAHYGQPKASPFTGALGLAVEAASGSAPA